VKNYKSKILETRNQTNVIYKGLFFQDLHKTVRLFNEDSDYLRYIWHNIENFKPRKKR